MYINADVIIKIAAVLTALIAIGTAAYKAVKWMQAQDKQTKDIEELRKKEAGDIQDLKDLLSAVLSSSDGRIAWLTGEQIGLAKETVAWAYLERSRPKKR